ncbi:MAG: hypothetical protein JWN04_2723 [Myxococcaceae bacterium]|nr:hypothetical protein [Myxococcaceae bacterium]
MCAYDYDFDTFVPVPPHGASSNDMDVDFVKIGDIWYKIGPWDADEDGRPDDGFDQANPEDLELIMDWDARHGDNDCH